MCKYTTCVENKTAELCCYPMFLCFNCFQNLSVFFCHSLFCLRNDSTERLLNQLVFHVGTISININLLAKIKLVGKLNFNFSSGFNGTLTHADRIYMHCQTILALFYFWLRFNYHSLLLREK